MGSVMRRLFSKKSANWHFARLPLHWLALAEQRRPRTAPSLKSSTVVTIKTMVQSPYLIVVCVVAATPTSAAAPWRFGSRRVGCGGKILLSGLHADH